MIRITDELAAFHHTEREEFNLVTGTVRIIWRPITRALCCELGAPRTRIVKDKEKQDLISANQLK